MAENGGLVVSPIPETKKRQDEPRLAQFNLASKRMNMVRRASEVWRPPPLAPSNGSLAKIADSLRRFLDLQAGSIWRDLSEILPHARGTVLDVGCGAQPYRSLLSPAAAYTAIDTVDSAAHFGYEAPDTRYFSGTTWPVEDASVDFILCTETMEHVPDSAVMIGQTFRCLAPGGTLLLTVPFAARWHFIPYDYWRFTPSGLDRLLASGGFVNRRVYARGNAVTVACYKVMALLLRLGAPQTQSALGRLGLRILFLPFAPLLLALAIAANISMRGQGGDDCLGYTVLAEKPAHG